MQQTHMENDRSTSWLNVNVIVVSFPQEVHRELTAGVLSPHEARLIKGGQA